MNWRLLLYIISAIYAFGFGIAGFAGLLKANDRRLLSRKREARRADHLRIPNSVWVYHMTYCALSAGLSWPITVFRGWKEARQYLVNHKINQTTREENPWQ